jgi:hypothetical protein
MISKIEQDVADGTMPAVSAVQKLIAIFEGKRMQEGKQTRL